MGQSPEQKTRIPIRFKILLSVLLVIGAVVSIITFTMASFFHQDKTAYIHDLTSVIALHTTEEAEELVSGYREKMHIFARLMRSESLSPGQRSSLLQGLFEDFREFMAITIYEDGVEQGMIYDSASLEKAGLSSEDLRNYRKQHPLPFERITPQQSLIENSTLNEALPMLTLATVLDNGTGEKTVTLVGWIRLDRLLHMVSRSKVFDTYLVDPQGVFLAHSDAAKARRREKADGVFDEPPPKGLVKSMEIEQDGKQLVAGFARTRGQDLLVAVQIPKTAAYLTSRQLLNNLVGVALALLISAALMSLMWSRKLTAPLERLSGAAKKIGQGQFDIEITQDTQDEIGELAGSFNQMTRELKDREVALAEAHQQLVQSEKMAAFGQLGAGIAHEIKNPLAGIIGFAQLALRKAEKDSPLLKNITIIEKESRRCKEIIDSLLKFARSEDTATEGVAINQVVEDAVAIVDHQLGIAGIGLTKDLADELPPITGSANQLQQVMMNFMINAQQAMAEKPGSITISTALNGKGKVEITVRDTGPGIPEEIQTRIFEPFFTTKESSKGTGLGLSVSYRIIRDHNGEVHLESTPGEGASFIVTLPPMGPKVYDKADNEVGSELAAGAQGAQI